MALQTGRALPSLDSALSVIEKSALSIRDRCADLSAKAAASAEYTALQSVVYAALDFIEANLPTPNGAFSGRVFQFTAYSPSQTSNLRTHLNNVVAAIS